MISRAAARLARIERKTAPDERRIVVVGDSDELELATKFLRSKGVDLGTIIFVNTGVRRSTPDELFARLAGVSK